MNEENEYPLREDEVLHSVESGQMESPPPDEASSSQQPTISPQQSTAPDTSSSGAPLHNLTTAELPHASASNISHGLISYFASSSVNTPISTVGRQVLRAEKDAVDPTESLYRRRMPLDRSGSTRTAIDTLFKAQSPDLQPSPNQTSFLSSTSPEPSLQPQRLALGNHIYHAGLLEGRHSDICVNAFGRKYRLHRLILEQAPFFASAFSGPWVESKASEIDLHPTDMDPNITQEAFELALKRLYGFSDFREETFHCIALLPTASWLDMPDLVNDSVEIIIRTLDPTHLSPVINLVTSSYYGKAGEIILQSAIILLKRHGGVDIKPRCWDYISATMVKDIVGADDFFVDSEWDRWILARKLLNRRLKILASASGIDPKSTTSQNALLVIRRAGRNRLALPTEESISDKGSERTALRQWIALYSQPDIKVLYELLDGLGYIHFEFESLQKIKGARDVFGVPILRPSLINKALWTSLDLRREILCADMNDAQVGLAKLYKDVDATIPEEAQSTPIVSGKDGSDNGIEYNQSDDENGEGTSSGQRQKYLIPLCDCNISIGANPMPHKDSEDRKRARNQSRYQGQDITVNTATEGGDTAELEQEEPNQQKYSTFPPFRFSVEFPGARLLDERKHIHSRTVFYAGSFWNVYVHKLRKERKDTKAPQLGVYLRRAEGPGDGGNGERRHKRYGYSVNEQIGELEREMLQSDTRPQRFHSNTMTAADEALALANDFTASSVGVSGPSSFPIAIGDSVNQNRRPETVLYDSANVQQARESLESSDENGSLEESPSNPRVIQPYKDNRPFVKAYFKIFCPSPGGRSLIVWESQPDSFSLRQSWGWRSSSLLADISPSQMANDGGNEDSTVQNQAESTNPTAGHDGESELGLGRRQLSSDSHLRFSVVIGIV